MTKKRKTLIETARMTIASVKKEMEMSRLTESVRNDSGYQAELGGRNTCPLREILQSAIKDLSVLAKSSGSQSSFVRWLAR
jgi:hypothetical protein